MQTIACLLMGHDFRFVDAPPSATRIVVTENSIMCPKCGEVRAFVPPPMNSRVAGAR